MRFFVNSYGSMLVLVFGLMCCASMVWIGVAWGLESVRRPRERWHRRLRWSWVVAIGLASGVVAATVVATFSIAFATPDPWEYLLNAGGPLLVGLGGTFLGCGVLPAVAAGFLTRMAAKATGFWCRSCGYDLRAAQGDRCPECGQTIDRSVRASSGFGLARSRLAFAARTAAWSVFALVLLSAGGLMVYDVGCQPGVATQAAWCPKCGATNLERSSQWLGLWQPSQACFWFPGSAQCSHTWTRTPLTRPPSRALLLDPFTGHAIVFSVMDAKDPSGPPWYGALEVGECDWGPWQGRTPSIRAEFTLRWRKGPGLLTAPDARSARITLVSSPSRTATWGREYDGPYLDGCEAPSEEAAVRELLQLSSPGTARRTSRLAFTLGAPVGFRTVPAFYDTGAADTPMVVVTGTTGEISSLAPVTSPLSKISVAAIAHDEWRTRRDEPAPWKGVRLQRDGWEQFGAPITPALPTAALTVAPTAG